MATVAEPRHYRRPQTPQPSFDVKIIGGRRVIIWHVNKNDDNDAKNNNDEDETGHMRSRDNENHLNPERLREMDGHVSKDSGVVSDYDSDRGFGDQARREYSQRHQSGHQGSRHDSSGGGNPDYHNGNYHMDYDDDDIYNDQIDKQFHGHDNRHRDEPSLCRGRPCGR